MGFPGYFLIVADFINWAKDHDIPVGPGRGSGAGSLVAWALGITDLDPLPLRPAVRALPQPRTRVDARLRHRLLHGPPRRGHRLRRAQVRPRSRQPDHHLRHHGREGGGARHRPRARPSVRLRRRHRQAHPATRSALRWTTRWASRTRRRRTGTLASSDLIQRYHERGRRPRPDGPGAQPRRPDAQRRQARRRRGDRAERRCPTSARCSPNTTAKAAAATRSRSSTRTTSKPSAW